MILNFPYLHKNEILYSGIARYYDYLNEYRVKWISEQLFNTRQLTAIVNFPAMLYNFHKNLPNNNPYNPEYIIENHTLYPLFRTFMNEEKDEKLTNDMIYKNGQGLHSRTGIISSSIPFKNQLYYCSGCIKEQLENSQFVDFYWNRIHQCPGILVCHRHREWLKKTDFILDTINKQRYLSVGSLIDQGKIDLSLTPLEENKINEFHIKVSESAEWIISNNLKARHQDYYRLRYKEYLKALDIVQLNNRVISLKLKEFILREYPKEFLQQISSDFDINADYNWPQMILQKSPKSFHPIRHILMMVLLAGSASSFYTQEFSYKPFGDGPWKCRNKICSDNTEFSKIGYSRSAKKRYVLFSCVCGFSERRYSDNSSKTITLGWKWEEKLIELVNNKKDLTYISNFLNVDKQTVKKYSEINGLSVSWTPPKKVYPRTKKKNINHYDIWLRTVNDNDNLKLSYLRKLVPATYMWLYRNDKKFLKENTSKCIKNPPIKQKIDWKKRDEDMLECVKGIVENWDKNVKRPQRRTSTLIAKLTEKRSWLEKKTNYFPLTMSYIKTRVETIGEFQVRRVKWLLKNEYGNKCIKLWEIHRRAGLTPKVSTMVLAKVSEEVEKHNDKVSKIVPK